MQTPDISVIVPCYNAEKYLDECLKSLHEQQNPELEFIFIDDGSKDQTGNKLDRFAAADCRAKVLHIENAGVSNARNRGIDEARGKYIAFLDADDCYEPEALYKLWREAETENLQIVSGVHSVLTEQGETPIEPAYAGNDSEAIVRRIIHMDKIYNNVWNKLYLRALFSDKIRFDSRVKIGEDAVVNLQLYHNASKVKQISEHTYLYRVHSGSAMAKSGLYCEAHLPMLKAMNEILLNNQMKEQCFRDYLESVVWIHEKETGILYLIRIFNGKVRPLVLSGIDAQKISREDRTLYRTVCGGFFPSWYVLQRIKRKLHLSGGRL